MPAKKVFTEEEIKEIIAQYEGGLGTREVGKLHGCTLNVINKILRKNNVMFRYTTKGKKMVGVIKPDTRILIDYDEAVKLYLSGKTILEIAKIFNCSTTPVTRVLKERGIKTRRRTKKRKAPQVYDFSNSNDNFLKPQIIYTPLYEDTIVSGIYKIICLGNNKIYVGSSKDIYARLRRHIGKLSNLNHNNRHLQGSYNKYGESSIRFEILQEGIEAGDLHKLESEWIVKLDSINPLIGFNFSSDTYGGKVYDVHPLLGKKVTDEHRDNLRRGQRNSKFTNNKLKAEDVIKIRQMVNDGIKYKDIATIFNIDSSYISNIKNRKVWSDI